MKVGEEIRRVNTIKTGIKTCKSAAATVINPNKHKYMAELDAAIVHIDKAIEVLKNFQEGVK